MKRNTILLLSFLLIITSFHNTYATDMLSNTKELYEHEFLKEDDYTERLIDEDFTRAEMMVLLARLNGTENQVENFSLLSSFSDVEDHWAEHYIAYAELMHWTEGVNMGTFNPDQSLSKSEFSEFILRYLDYHTIGTDQWKTAVQDFESFGIKMPEETFTTENIFELIMEASQLDKKEETIVETEDSSDQDPIQLSKGFALTPTLIQVELEERIDQFDEELLVLEDQAGELLSIESVIHAPWDEENKTFFIRLEDKLAIGELYQLSSDESRIYITGLVDDEKEPVIMDIYSEDYNQVIIEFNEAIDKDTLEVNITQMYEDQETLEIVDITYDGPSTIILTTTEQQAATLYKLAIDTVDDLSGNSLSDEFSDTFVGKEKDDDLQEIISAKAYDSKTVDVFFRTDINKKQALDISNYEIKEKYFDQTVNPVINAVLVYEEDEPVENVVTLTLENHLTAGLYELSVDTVGTRYGKTLDTDQDTVTFTGIEEDTTAPEEIISIKSLNSRELQVKLKDDSAINSKITKDLFVIQEKYTNEESLDVLAVKEIDGSRIILTTEQQKSATLYELKIKEGLTDVWENSTTKELSETFTGKFTDKPITEVTVRNVDYDTYLITFDQPYGDGALAVENYTTSNFGHPIKVEAVENGEQYQDTVIADDDRTVKMTMKGLAQGILYELTVRDIFNEDGIAMDEKELTDKFSVQYLLETDQ